RRDGTGEQRDRGNELLPKGALRNVRGIGRFRPPRSRHFRQRDQVRELGKLHLGKASEVGRLSLDEELSRVGSIAVSTRRNGQKSETDEPIEKRSGAPRRDARLLRQSLDRVGPRLNVREDGMVDGGGQDRESPAAR